MKKRGFPGDKPTGKKRVFEVTVTTTTLMTLDESVIEQGLADDGYIMKNPTLDDVVEHLAHNLIGTGLSLSQVDGYANCPDDSATVKVGIRDIEWREVKR